MSQAGVQTVLEPGASTGWVGIIDASFLLGQAQAENHVSMGTGKYDYPNVIFFPISLAVEDQPGRTQ
jgi:hypothetical protein